MSTGYSYLDSLKASIDDYKSQHLDNIESAMNRDDYYGNTYSYNKNVEAYNHNLVYYNQQIDSYNSQRLTYNAEVDKFNAVLKAFYPSKTLLNTKQ